MIESQKEFLNPEMYPTLNDGTLHWIIEPLEWILERIMNTWTLNRILHWIIES